MRLRSRLAVVLVATWLRHHLAAFVWLEFSSVCLAGARGCGMGGCCAGVFRFAGGSAERFAGGSAENAGSADSRAGSAGSTRPFLVIPPLVFDPLMECTPAQRGAVLAGAMDAINRISDGADPQLWGQGQRSENFRFTFELRPSSRASNGQELILESWEELP